MSDLPSRERIAEAVTFAHITDSDGDLLQDIGTAYVEGRVVDRGVLEVTECPGDDATCPGHDHGDSCHYRDIPNSPAMPIGEQVIDE